MAVSNQGRTKYNFSDFKIDFPFQGFDFPEGGSRGYYEIEFYELVFL